MKTSAARLSILGELVGYRKSREGAVVSEIVHITTEHRPDGPAENAFVEVDVAAGKRRGRYLSWINYFDLEYASRREVGQWDVVEPATPYKEQMLWVPFGWEGFRRVPTIGDSILDQMRRQSLHRESDQ